MTLKYSVVIPVYNVEAYLRKCVDSVLCQHSSFEVILVDDGSTDSSGVICDEYAKLDNRVRVIHQENKWLSAARNTGIRAANGEYVVFLDSDDYWEPDMLQTLDGLLSQPVDMALFGLNRVEEESCIEPNGIHVIPNGESGKSYLEKLYSLDHMPFPYAWVYVHRREFLVENSLFFKEDLRASEDYEHTMRALPLARSLVGTEKALYNYMLREGSLTSSWPKKKIMDNLICKSSVFRRWPASAVANDYMWFVLGHANRVGKDGYEILAFIKENKDIFEYVTQPTLKKARNMIQLLGCKWGIKVFCGLSGIKNQLKRLSFR